MIKYFMKKFICVICMNIMNYNILNFGFGILMSLSVFNTVYATDFIYQDTYVPDIGIVDDTVITDSVVVDVENINVMNTVLITNNGVLHGNVNVCDGCDIFIENNGDMDVDFNKLGYSSIIQLISDASSMNSVGDASNVQIVIDNADGLSLSGLQDVAHGAEKLTVNNSSFVLDGILDDDVEMPDAELHGDIVLYVSDDFVLPSGPIMSNVYGDADISVSGGGLSPLYLFSAYVQDNSVYLHYVRNTDYAQIFNNPIGSFLNNLRNYNPNDKIFNMLDSAGSMTDLNNVIARSGRTNPIRLMDSVRLFDDFEMFDMPDKYSGIGIAPIALYANDFYTYGLSVDAAFNITDKWLVNASGYIAKTDFASDIDEYKSALYGGNVHIAYFDNSWFADVVTGTNIAKFDVGAVLQGASVINNPDGFSVYSVANLGLNFDIKHNFVVSPFVRMGVHWLEIADNTDMDIIAGGGASAVIKVDMYDIDYQYGIRVGADFSGDIDAMAYVDILSNADGAGGTLGIGIVYDDIVGIGYKAIVGLGVKF